jgi:hypothetical protein
MRQKHEPLSYEDHESELQHKPCVFNSLAHHISRL